MAFYTKKRLRTIIFACSDAIIREVGYIAYYAQETPDKSEKELFMEECCFLFLVLLFNCHNLRIMPRRRADKIFWNAWERTLLHLGYYFYVDFGLSDNLYHELYTLFHMVHRNSFLKNTTAEEEDACRFILDEHKKYDSKEMEQLLLSAIRRLKKDFIIIFSNF